MSQICPHCAHVRKASDTTPEWQCPACEKAYRKDGDALPPVTRVQSASSNEPRRAGGMAKWLLFLLLLGASFWFARPLLQHRAVSPAALAAGQPAVVLYATDWCGYCKAARAFFQANDIRYVEYNIDKSTEAYKQHKKNGGRGVPLIVVGEEVIGGYNEAALRQLLRPWLKG